VAGTEPRDTCDEQQGMKGVFSRLFGSGSKPVMPQAAPGNGQDANNQQDPNKKKGFFGKLAGIFKDDKNSTPTTPPATTPAKPADPGQTAPH